MTETKQTQGNQKFEIDGVVEECLPSTVFRIKIEIDGKEHFVIGHLSGKMRMNYIKIMKGDKVRVEISPYDISKARIVYRYKK